MFEKRLYPRVAATLPAVIADEDGFRYKTVALNASSDGLCIQCDTAARNIFTPGGSFIRDGRPVELYVWLDLPNNGQLSARCHITFSRRIAKDICQIGMRYMDFDQEGYNKLLQFIESSVSCNETCPDRTSN